LNRRMAGDTRSHKGSIRFVGSTAGVRYVTAFKTPSLEVGNHRLGARDTERGSGPFSSPRGVTRCGMLTSPTALYLRARGAFVTCTGARSCNNWAETEHGGNGSDAQSPNIGIHGATDWGKFRSRSRPSGLAATDVSSHKPTARAFQALQEWL
jgi:hypothetical protein